MLFKPEEKLLQIKNTSIHLKAKFDILTCQFFMPCKLLIADTYEKIIARYSEQGVPRLRINL